MEATRETTVSYRSTAARLGARGLVVQAARELASRRRLIGYIVQADLKKKGADTLLGNVWWVLDPLLQMLVYVVLVSVILNRSQPDYPLFVFAAILPWKWFTTAVGDAITSVSSQDRLIKQMQFPKIVLPTAATVAGVANFVFGLFALIALLLLFYRDRATPYLVFIPAIAAVQFVLTLAVAYVVSGVNVFYRDVGNVSRHALRLWFYLSPGLYGVAALESIAQAHPTLIQLMALNPFYVLFNAYRAVIFDGLPPDWVGLGVLLLASVGLLGIATVFFKRLEPSFAKVL